MIRLLTLLSVFYLNYTIALAQSAKNPCDALVTLSSDNPIVSYDQTDWQQADQNTDLFCSYPNSRNNWYKVVVPNSGYFEVNLEASYWAARIEIYEENCDSLNSIDCKNLNYDYKIISDQTPGDTLLLRFVSLYSTTQGNLIYRALEGGGNETCLNAKTLNLTTRQAIDTFNSINSYPSKVPLESLFCSSSGHNSHVDVWYKFTIPPTGTPLIQINSINDSYGLIADVYAGSCDDLSFVSCNTLDGANGLLTSLSDRNIGDEIYLRINDQRAKEGANYELKINIIEDVENDSCLVSEFFRVGDNFEQINIQSANPSNSIQSPHPCINPNSNHRDVWFKSVKSQNGNLNFKWNDDGNNSSSAVEIYKGNCKNLDYVFCKRSYDLTNDFNINLESIPLNDTFYVRLIYRYVNNNDTIKIRTRWIPEIDNNTCLESIERVVTDSFNLDTLSFEYATHTEVLACDANAQSLWYRMEVPETGMFKIHIDHLKNINGRTEIGIYRGSCSSNDFFSCYNANIPYSSTLGSIFFTQFSKEDELFFELNPVYSDFDGELAFGVETVHPPFNDSCHLAKFINIDSCSSESLTFLGSTRSLSHLTNTNCGYYNFSQYYDLWYAFEIPPSGHYEIFSELNSRAEHYSQECESPVLLNCLEFYDNVYRDTGIPGDTMILRFPSYREYSYSYKLEICELNPVPNDDCSNALFVTVLDTFEYDTISTRAITSSSITYPNGTCGAGSQNPDIWFKFQVPNSGMVEISSNFYNRAGHNIRAQHDFFLGSCSQLILESCESYIYSNENIRLIDLTPGDTILYQMKRRYSNDPIDRTAIAIREIPQAPNDSCLHAQTLYPSIEESIDTFVFQGALPSNTPTNNISCNSYSSSAHYDLWFKTSQPQGDSLLFLSSKRIRHSFGIEVYEGTCEGLVSIFCDQGFYQNNVLLNPNSDSSDIFIRVVSYQFLTDGKFALSLVKKEPESNDLCHNALTINVLPDCQSDTFSISSTSFSAISYSSQCPYWQGFQEERDIWFKAEVPNSGSFKINATSVNQNSVFIEPFESSCANLVPIICERQYGSGYPNEILIQNQTPDDSVLIRVYQQYPRSFSDIIICAQEIYPPLNDECNNAIHLDVTQECIVDTFTIKDATASQIQTNCIANKNHRDIWYSIEVPPSGIFSIETKHISGELSELYLGVYRNQCDSLEEVWCGPRTYGDWPSAVINTENPGDTLLIRIAEWHSDEEGLFGLCIYEIPQIANDNCHSAIELSSTQCEPTMVNLWGAKSSEWSETCYYEAHNDAWYKVKIPSNGKLKITTQKISDRNGSISIRTYLSDCGNLTYNSCNYQHWYQSNRSFNLSSLPPNSTLYIQVGSQDPQDFPSFEICVEDPSTKLLLSNIIDSSNNLACIPVHTQNFNDVALMLFGIEYDNKTLKFDTIDSFNLSGFSQDNVEINEKEGVISFLWVDHNFEGKTLPGNTQLFNLCFELIGTNNNCSDISIADNRLTNTEMTRMNTEYKNSFQNSSGIQFVNGRGIPMDFTTTTGKICFESCIESLEMKEDITENYKVNAMNTVSANSAIHSPAQVTFRSQTEIELDTGFTVQQGATLEAIIEECPE